MKGKSYHRKRGIIAVGAIMVACLALAASALAAAEHVSRGAAVNPKTCKFLTPEKDPATGPTWKNLRTYVIYEDARHDAKVACLQNHMGGKRGPAGPAGPAGVSGYVQVKATGTTHTVTATCPQGDVVLGGGSPSETTGSYPSSTSAWTVVRDHLSPKRLTVIATCAEAS